MCEPKNIYKVEIDERQEGARIDVALSSILEQMSRSAIQKLIDNNNVIVNNGVCKSKNTRVKLGDILEISIPELTPLDVEPEDIPLDIIYEDTDVLVINKEKNMVVHPAVGNYTGTLVNAILFHCKDLSGVNGVARPGIVHRIDKDTSGLLMIAKNDFAHQSLAKQLAAHTISRAYHAIVYNSFTEDEGTICQPIGRDPKNRLRQAVNTLNGKEAMTHYRVLERLGKFNYIEAKLETGRTHQIRVHMAYINHPLLGDPLYGPKKGAFGIKTQMLHAKILGFVHPRTGEYMEFESHLPDGFQSVLNRLRNDQK